MNIPPPTSLVPPWRRATAFFLDVVFPPVCAGCGRVGALLCPACAAQMERVTGPICPRCGQALEPGDNSTTLCRECRESPLVLCQMRAALRYQEPTSSLIHRFKYEGCFALATPLAGSLIAAWPAWEQPPDLIIPIPLHPRRKRRRGYNQSELLAAPLARALGLPLNPRGLQRVRHTAPQVGLGPEERHDNVHGAFVAANEVYQQRVLLIDDVLTTGATMRAAAEALLAAGAASVSAYCLARVN